MVGVLGISVGIGLLAWGTPSGTGTVASQPAAVSVMVAITAVALAPFALVAS